MLKLAPTSQQEQQLSQQVSPAQSNQQHLVAAQPQLQRQQAPAIQQQPVQQQEAVSAAQKKVQQQLLQRLQQQLAAQAPRNSRRLLAQSNATIGHTKQQGSAAAYDKVRTQSCG
jgi:hypothetical protein